VLVSDIAIFVLKRDVKFQLANWSSVTPSVLMVSEKGMGVQELE